MKLFPIDEIDYSKYINKKINSRIFSFDTIQNLIAENQTFRWQLLGLSFEGRPIKMASFGKGPIKIMMWSQMHGNEPTATAAIFDLLNFFKSADFSFIDDIIKACTIYFIPVINPDGLEKFTRRNAQEIDINRDFLAQQSPEGRILREIHSKLKPDFALNLHDQDMLYNTPETKKTVAMSLLAPSVSDEKNTDWTREQAMKVISCINHVLQKIKPLQIARFKDEFEPRAFGDNFQKAGSATILIESGYLEGDEEQQEIRKLNFFAILAALHAISFKYYQEKDLINYLMIPEQKKQLLHLMIRNCIIKKHQKAYTVSIGLNYEEVMATNRSLKKIWNIVDFGDLSTFTGLEEYNAKQCEVNAEIRIDEPANLILLDQDQEIIFKFEKGIRV